MINEQNFKEYLLPNMFEEKIRRIKWLGEDLILVGETHGAIATEEQYLKGKCPLGHLYPSGDISVFGEYAGTKDDIEFGEFIKLEPDILAKFGSNR